MSRRLMCWTSARIQKNTSFFTAVVTIYCRLPRSEIGVLSSYTRCLPLPNSTDGKKEKYLFAVGWTPGSCHRRSCRTFVSIMFWNKICFYRSCFFQCENKLTPSPVHSASRVTTVKALGFSMLFLTEFSKFDVQGQTIVFLGIIIYENLIFVSFYLCVRPRII